MPVFPVLIPESIAVERASLLFAIVLSDSEDRTFCLSELMFCGTITRVAALQLEYSMCGPNPLLLREEMGVGDFLPIVWSCAGGKVLW